MASGESHMRAFGLLTVILAVMGAPYAHAQFPDQDMRVLRDSVTNVPYGYFYDPSKWAFTTIPVCWENPSDTFANEMTMVRDAVASSWEKHSRLRFTGWLKCEPRNEGIRILIDDSGPHVQDLGNRINGKRNGMVLNFTFANWGQSCASAPVLKEKCVRSIGVHEFGHALGFAHEQNRPDTPGECTQAPQGPDGNVLLTPYDPQSVMNYCNPIYNNDGMLSELDIKSVQTVYGGP